MNRLVNLIMVFHILQWNARSLISNGQELKKAVGELTVNPDIICIQESWLCPQVDFVIQGYSSIRCDRKQKQGGGCVTFVKDNVAYKRVKVSDMYECIVIEICSPRCDIKVINFYNPCDKLSLQMLNEIGGSSHVREIWCGDFNAHNTLWGSEHTNANGEIIEQLMEDRILTCLNDGSGTRIDVRTNRTSCLDLTIVSGKMSSLCEWNVMSDNNLGSDHFPIICSLNFELYVQEGYDIERWCFGKADWNKFVKCCIEYCEDLSMDGDIDYCAGSVTAMITRAATASIPKKSISGKKKSVPWWNEECTRAIRDRNRAFRVLRRQLNQDNIIDYQKKRALARKVIKTAKKNTWRKFCSSIGREVQLGDIWSMIKKMSGKRKYNKIPVLIDGDFQAITNKEKADLLGKKFAGVHIVEAI